MKNFENKMSLEKGKLLGGFSSLNEVQLSKVKGGKNHLETNICDTNGQCLNTHCGSNESC